MVVLGGGAASAAADGPVHRGVPFMHSPEREKAADMVKLGGHRLLAVPVLRPGIGTVLACTACGGYAWYKAHLLAGPCPGHPLSDGARTRRARFLKGKFLAAGAQGDWLLGRPWAPPSAVVAWLAGCRGRKARRTESAQLEAEAVQDAVRWGTPAYKGEVLARLGLTWAALAGLVTEVTEERATRAGLGAGRPKRGFPGRPHGTP